MINIGPWVLNIKQHCLPHQFWQTMHKMMKELITSKSIYQLPHVKNLINDLDNNYKPTNLMTKNVINFNDNKTIKNDEITTKPLQYKQNLLMHHPPLNNAHI
jgi:hypothetical protein